MTIRIEDSRGFIIKSLIYLILWYSNFIQPKYFQIPNLLLVLGVLLLLTIISDWGKTDVLFSRGNIPTAFYSIVLYFILILPLGVVSSPSLSLHITQWITSFEYLLIMFAIVYYSVTRNNVAWIMKCLMLLAMVMAIVFIMDPVPCSDGANVRYSFSESYNPNAFAMNLTIATAIILYFLQTKKISAILAIPFTGAFIYSVILTGSRKGLIGLLLCIVLWFFVCFFPGHGKLSLKKIAAIVAIIVIGIVAYRFFLPIYSSSTLAFRMTYLKSEVTSGTRWEMYQYGWKLFKNSPIVGYGLEGFIYFYGKYSHSTIIEVLVCSGLPLAMLYFSSYFQIVKQGMLNFRLSKRNGNYDENLAMRFVSIIFILMLFYAFCVIHIYDLASFVNFGFILSAIALNYNTKQTVD